QPSRGLWKKRGKREADRREQRQVREQGEEASESRCLPGSWWGGGSVIIDREWDRVQLDLIEFHNPPSRFSSQFAVRSSQLAANPAKAIIAVSSQHAEHQ